MMLVQLPAMDNVPGLSFVDRLPSFSLPDRLSSLSHRLYNPNLWLTVLATMVILSSIRAALLFFRPMRSKFQMGGVSIIPGFGIIRSQKGAQGGSTSTTTNGGVSVMREKQDEKKMSSLLWGLVKWDTLPALPIPRRDAGAVSVSETERGRSTPQRQQGLRIQLPQSRRPAFDSPRMCLVCLPFITRIEITLC